jgi:hypothetical protein
MKKEKSDVFGRNKAGSRNSLFITQQYSNLPASARAVAQLKYFRILAAKVNIISELQKNISKFIKNGQRGNYTLTCLRYRQTPDS